MRRKARKVAPTTKRKGGRKPQLTVIAMTAALIEECGNIRSVALRFKVSRTAVQHFIANNPELEKVRDEAKEERIDRYEAAIDLARDRGEIASIIYFLKTQGRSRGYAENEYLNEMARQIDQLRAMIQSHADTLRSAKEPVGTHHRNGVLSAHPSPN